MVTADRGRGRRGSGRGRGRGRPRRRRGRGGEEAPQEIHQAEYIINQQNSTDQDYPYSSPLSSRYPTRHPPAVLCQFANLTSPLRSPIRSIKKTPSPPISQTIGEELVCENAAEDGETSVSTRSPSWSCPSSKHMPGQDNICLEITSQFQGTQEAQQVDNEPALSQDLHGNYQPSMENYVVAHVESKPEKSTTNFVHGHSPSHSVDITEFAQRQLDDVEDDPEEVVSAPGPGFDIVHGHKVRIQAAPLLRDIFERYGDITVGTDVKSSYILSIFLERLCDIYRRLEETNFFHVTTIDLNEMLDEVRDFDREKLNVRWLLEKLENISQAKTGFQEYLSVKKEAAKCNASLRIIDKELEAYEREISLLQQKITAKREERAVIEVKADHVRKVALDTRTRVNTLANQSLVHGLL